MLGFKRTIAKERLDPSQNVDVAKLFFDTFSERLASLETALKLQSADIERLNISGDHAKLSDLVLLERLQKSEKILGESLNWIRQIADAVLQALPATPGVRIDEGMPNLTAPDPVDRSRQIPPPEARHDPSIIQPGTLNSITTPTELQVLTFLANEGPKSAPEIGRFVARSREHTARLMKRLFDEGYVRRDQTRIPFRYSTVERLKSSLTKQVQKDQGQEVASAPQA